jgi:FdrA protein
MAGGTRVVRNLYRDSVSLMQLSNTLGALPGIGGASVVMATDANLELLRAAGLAKGTIQAGPNDLLIALEGKSDKALADAFQHAESALRAEPAQATGNGAAALAPRSIRMAVAAEPAASLALISTPGEYAAAEARKALASGLDVMLFSDNVSLEDEIALKRLARAKGRIVMGPDCGTAIVNGVPLAFANVVRRGPIGCVAASGTGLQQVTCLIDRLGSGISHAIGTGGHDLHKDVGGITMLTGIRALGADPSTKVLVLISKPPAPEVARKVLRAASAIGKPVVVNFVGAAPGSISGKNLYPAQTLEDAAHTAVALAQGRKPSAGRGRAAGTKRPRFAASQRFVRGLYSGGTFCYEASMLLGEAFDNVWSNAPVRAEQRIQDVWKSREHTLIDLGDDEFTRGRPHPMIDHRLRNERMVKEAADPQTAVILLDVVLGHGSHPDPASMMVPAIEAARKRAGKRTLAFVGSVCGTDADPQNRGRQEAALRAAGMMLAPSNAAAVRLAASLVGRKGSA